MSTRGFLVLAQNSYNLDTIVEEPVLKKEYTGIKVDIWYDEVEHLAGQHVFYKNNVYKMKRYQPCNTKFNPDNADFLLRNVRLLDDKNKSLTFNRAKKGNIVLKNNDLFKVEEEDTTEIDLEPQYKGIEVSVWYDEVEHVKGQHVWYENNVYKMDIDTPKDTKFSKSAATLIIENVKLYDDENQSLIFDQVNVYDIVLKNNKIYQVRPALDTDYVLQACVLAMSIKATNPNEKISIITDEPVPQDYVKLFDKIIDIPFGDEAQFSDWKIENRWKLYHASPYDKTIVLDTDVLVLQNIDAWWNYLENFDLYFTSKVYTYRGEIISDDYYRKTFTANNLPNLYAGFHYFKKSDTAQEFYKWLELVVKNWQQFYQTHCPKNTPPRPSIDVSASIVANLLSNENIITNKNDNMIKFVHMKPRIQNWNLPKNRWQDCVSTYIDEKCNLKVGNYTQAGIFHYTEKDFLSNKIIERYRNLIHV